VKDDASDVASASADRHLEGVGDDLGARAGRQLPPKDPRGALVAHAAPVDVADADLQVRDVARPEHVGFVGAEVTLDQVLGVDVVGPRQRRDPEGTRAHPGDPKVGHARGDGVLRDPFTVFEQVERDARGAVSAAARAVKGQYLHL
jgi:hypothetical protein